MMKTTEELLKNKKSEIDQIQVPEELESRLRSVLKDHSSSLKPARRWNLKAAVLLACVVIMILTYNIDTLAFYGKKLIGYDSIMSNSLKKLNELGKGQVIGKSYTFKNGVTVTLDGVMIDYNQLLMYYTIKDPRAKVDLINIVSDLWMNEKSGIYMGKYGQGEISTDNREVKWIEVFEPPYPGEKELRWTVTLLEGHKSETGEIPFKLDRSKAMGYMLKKNINKAIKIDEGKMQFESITASPTTTVIKGKLQKSLQLALAQVTKRRFRPVELDLKLIANGKELPQQVGKMNTDIKGISFEAEYEPLPRDLNSLQIHLASFTADHDVYQQIPLRKGGKNESIQILGQNIDIDKVYEIDDQTYITISTEESVVLSKTYLIMDGKKIKLQETISDEHSEKTDGTTTHTRTLHFDGVGENLQLDIRKIKYKKVYNRFVDVPIN
jgi:hypothetical protein